MSQQTAPLPTRNEAYGFYGTIALHEDAQEAWHIAFEHIAKATQEAPETIRDFLDSRDGRLLADDIRDITYDGKTRIEHAIPQVIENWMQKRNNSSLTTQKACSSRGMPLLISCIRQYSPSEDPKLPAINQFILQKERIDIMIGQLELMSDEHFGYSADNIDWENVAVLWNIADNLEKLINKI